MTTTAKTKLPDMPKSQATIWTGYWDGMQPRMRTTRLLDGNAAINEALTGLPGFNEVEVALRRFVSDRNQLVETPPPSTGELVTGLVARYQDDADLIDMAAEFEAFVNTDALTRQYADFNESHRLVGEALLTRRQEIAENNIDKIAARLTGQLTRLVEWLRDAGVDNETARLARTTSREGLTDVEALRRALPEFELLRSASDLVLSDVVFTSSNAAVTALIKVIDDPIAVDRYWPITFEGRRIAQSRKTGETVSVPVVPNFLDEDPAMVLAWLAANPDVELRIPSPHQAKAASERLNGELRRASEAAAKRWDIRFRRGNEHLGHVASVWKSTKPTGWTATVATDDDSGSGEVWTVKPAAESLVY